MQKKIIYLIVNLIGIFAFANATFAQSNPSFLKGKVVDSGGEPLIGAVVKWKDAKTGTITNVEGNFSIEKNASTNVLTVSCIGFKSSEVTIGKEQTSIDVKLKDDAQHLDELVVVGYGVQKKNSLTGSVETIKAADLLMAPTSNLDQALSGQAAGLQVMQTTGDPSTAKEASIHIRGINDSPLLVIDGVPRFGTSTGDGELRMSDLNPDDIESVTILKDAAASAVYGARAANGVILIQTKRSEGEQKLKINYRGQFNLQQAAHLPDFLNAYEFALLRNRAVANTPSTTVLPYTEEQLEQIRTHSNPNVFGDENILDYLDKTGWNTTHSVSASGGSKNVNYYLSFGYADSKGLYNKIGRKRLNYMAKIDVKLSKSLTLSTDFSGTRSNARNSSYSTIESAYSFSPLQVTTFTNGYLASDDGSNALININGLGGYIKENSKMNTINATLRWEVPWVKGLSAYLRGTFDDNNRMEINFSKPVTLYLYDAENDTYSEDPNTVYPSAKVTYTQQDAFYESQLYEMGINYNRTFAEKHNVGAMMVANYQRTHNQNMRGANLDKGIFPEIMGTVQDAQLYGTETKNQRASWIGRANYGYDDKYFFEFSFRVDGSNNFAPEHRWGFFPSFSGAWVLSNENFFKNWKQKVISNVKFRASTGWLGNDGLAGAYSYLKTYIESPNYGYSIGGNYRSGLMLQGNPNPNLTWGKTHDYNFATDLGFWGGRIGVSFEYFIRYDTDMITYAPEYLYPPSTGINGNVPNINFAKLKGWGWDLSINHKNTIGKFKYNVGLSLAKSDDEWLDYGDESAQNENLRRVGTSSLVWTMYVADGLFRSQEEIANYGVDQDGQGNATIAPGDIKYVDLNGDGKITALDQTYIKNSSYPDMDISFRFGLSYKGFYLNAMFMGEKGYTQNIKDYYTLENGTLQRFQRYHLTDTWSEDNPDASYPAIKFVTTSDNNRKTSNFWVKNCDFLRLKTLNIGYQVPTSALKKIHLTSASIALQGSNLFTITNLDDMDPESLRGYPIQRSYGVTVNLGF